MEILVYKIKYKIKYILFVMLLLIQSSVFGQGIEPVGFSRIRIDGIGVPLWEWMINTEGRNCKINEVMDVMGLSSELEGKAVVLGLQIQLGLQKQAAISRKYYLKLSTNVLNFIGTLEESLGIVISDDLVRNVAEKYNLRNVGQAYLLAFVQEVASVSDSENLLSEHSRIVIFFERLEYAIDTETVGKYLSLNNII